MEQCDLIKITSDEFLFPVLQGALFLFVLLAFYRATGFKWCRKIFQFTSQYLKGSRKAADNQMVLKGMDVTCTIKRSEASMNRFYATFAFISGLFIAVCLSSEIVKEYRVFWVSVDTSLIAYLCLFNSWFRNKLVQWSINLIIEK